MQITKKQFKEMLKEAIMELIEDGGLTTAIQEALHHSSGETPVSAFEILKSSQGQQVPQYLAESGGQVKYEASALSKINKMPSQLTNLVKATAHQQAGGNPLMESIFADTAMTTFAQQREGTAGLVPEGLVDQQEIVSETKQMQKLTADGDITRWAKVAALSMRK